MGTILDQLSTKTNIVDGPGKMDLMFNLFHFEARYSSPLQFGFEHGGIIYLRALAQGVKLMPGVDNDPKGNKFKIELVIVNPDDNTELGLIHAKYDTQTRTGRVTQVTKF